MAMGDPDMESCTRGRRVSVDEVFSPQAGSSDSAERWPGSAPPKPYKPSLTERLLSLETTPMCHDVVPLVLHKASVS